MFETITLDKIIRDSDNLIFHNDSYLISYPEFVKFFRKAKIITKNDLIIGINFTYGWMPRVFKFGSSDFDEAIKILNKAKQNIEIKSAELLSLINLFNNSLVGTSKILHFINPSKYAIWDSRVFRYLTGKEQYNSDFKNPDSYLNFNKFCLQIVKSPEYNLTHKKIEEKIGYKITKLRSVELIMFMNGKKK